MTKAGVSGVLSMYGLSGSYNGKLKTMYVNTTSTKVVKTIKDKVGEDPGFTIKMSKTKEV